MKIETFRFVGFDLKGASASLQEFMTPEGVRLTKFRMVPHDDNDKLPGVHMILSPAEVLAFRDAFKAFADTEVTHA